MIAIGEAAKQSGISIETIRYYEREGIITKADRNPSGRRVYTKENISELRFIKQCRELGFSISTVMELKQLARSMDGSCAAAERLGLAHLSKVRQKLKELKKLEIALSELVANCENGNTNCPMLASLMRQ